jgi:radical SAM-linked protein
MLRLFRRAFARAAIPIRHSEGFNPHPRITIPLPRPVGISSDAESIVIETVADMEPEGTVARLQGELPEGIRLTGLRRLALVERPRPVEARYRLTLEKSERADFSDRIEALMAGDSATALRKNPKTGKERSINIRTFLVDLRQIEDSVEFTLRVTGEGTAKPAEIAGLLGLDARFVNHLIHRVEVRWQ